MDAWLRIVLPALVLGLAASAWHIAQLAARIISVFDRCRPQRAIVVQPALLGHARRHSLTQEPIWAVRDGAGLAGGR